MVVVHPQVIPTEIMAETDFNLVPVTATNRLRSGAQYGTEISPYFWSAYLVTENLTIRDHGRWDGFIDACRGDLHYFLLYDTARMYPKAYKTFVGINIHGAGPFLGTANVSSFTNPRQVNLSALPDNFELQAGDMLGFEEGGRYSLHRVSQDNIGNASGVMSDLCFEPPITDQITSAATAQFLRPKGEFFLDPKSVRRGRKDLITPLSFKAIQRVV